MNGLILGFLQFTMISIICVWEVKRKSSSSFLWATLILMFGIMHLITTMSGNNFYSEKTLNKTSLFVLIFSILYFATRFILGQKSCLYNKKAFYKIGCGNIKKERCYNLYVFILVIVSFFMCIKLVKYSGGILNTSWASGRAQSTESSYVNIDSIISLLYYSSGGVLCYLLIKKEKMKAILIFLCLCSVVLITRDRMSIMPVLASIIAFVLFRIKKIRIRTILFGILAAVMVIFIIYGLRALRWYGSFNNVLEKFNISDFLDQINEFIKTDDGELGLRNYFYYFVEKNNEFIDFGKGHTYIRMFMVYIPTRFSMGLKPPDFAQTMGLATGGGVGSSMHPTLFGDCYANFGMFGVFLGIFWGIFVTIGDYIILKFRSDEVKVLAFVLFSSMYVMIGRGAVYNAFFKIAWGIPVLCVLEWFRKRFPKKQISWRKTSKHG